MSDIKINNITDRTGDSGPIFAGGYGSSSPGEMDTMDKIEIATAGNAIDFGNLSVARYNPAGGVASSTRGLFSGGRKEASPASNLTVIDYVVISSDGGANDWGDLPTARQTHDGASNNIRGLYGGGRGVYLSQPGNSALGMPTIEYVTIATTGRSDFFGDLITKRAILGAVGSSTRALFCGGYSTPAVTNVIEYVEFATTGNALDFGDLLEAGSGKACASNGTRGLITGLSHVGTGTNVIEYVTIASIGNGQDFGDLSVKRQGEGGTSNIIRGVFGGGATPSLQNVIDFVTIASTGDASDFGDLTQARASLKGVGDAHGGLN